MQIVGITLNWDLVPRLLPQHVREAFRDEPKKIKLEKGFSLYKFTEYSVRAGVHVSPWWSPVEPLGVDAGFDARVRLARHLSVSPSILTRCVAAVREDWNALDHILQVELKRPVHGFWGQCAPQDRVDAAQPNHTPENERGVTARLPGYAWQLYIPRMMLDDHVVLRSFVKV